MGRCEKKMRTKETPRLEVRVTVFPAWSAKTQPSEKGDGFLRAVEVYWGGTDWTVRTGEYQAPTRGFLYVPKRLGKTGERLTRQGRGGAKAAFRATATLGGT